MPARFTRTTSIDFDLGALLINFTTNELNVFTNVQHRVTPSFLLRLLAGKFVDQST
ncbi:hypothetical protein D3C85_1627140 [compost metagenome]